MRRQKLRNAVSVSFRRFLLQFLGHPVDRRLLKLSSSSSNKPTTVNSWRPNGSTKPRKSTASNWQTNCGLNCCWNWQVHVQRGEELGVAKCSLWKSIQWFTQFIHSFKILTCLAQSVSPQQMTLQQQEAWSLPETSWENKFYNYNETHEVSETNSQLTYIVCRIRLLYTPPSPTIDGRLFKLWLDSWIARWCLLVKIVWGGNGDIESWWAGQEWIALSSCSWKDCYPD